MPTLTFYETGRRLLVAADRWNSPRDAAEGILRDAWIAVPQEYERSVPYLLAGEWSEVDAGAYPGLYEKCKRAGDEARDRHVLRRNSALIEDWLSGKSVCLPYDLPIYLRVQGDEVVSSKGARFPVEHAKKALRLIRKVRETGEEYKRSDKTIHLGHYAIDVIDKHGNVKAGCHSVKWEQIDRVAKVIEGVA